MKRLEVANELKKLSVRGEKWEHVETLGVDSRPQRRRASPLLTLAPKNPNLAPDDRSRARNFSPLKSSNLSEDYSLFASTSVDPWRLTCRAAEDYTDKTPVVQILLDRAQAVTVGHKSYLVVPGGCWPVRIPLLGSLPLPVEWD